MAMPGYWKTTSRIQAAGSKPETRTDWHCVDDEVNPWTSFVPPPDQAGGDCARTTSQRTATSLQWHMECKGTAAVTSDGRLNFDSAQHYSGSILEMRQANGHRLQRKIRVEGQRYAACTTPAD